LCQELPLNDVAALAKTHLQPIAKPGRLKGWGIVAKELLYATSFQGRPTFLGATCTSTGIRAGPTALEKVPPIRRPLVNYRHLSLPGVV